MKQRLSFIIKYYLFWMALFIIQKLMFMGFNFSESKHLNMVDWIAVLWNGLRLDLSAAGYLMIIPVLFMSLLSFFEIRHTKSFLKIYNSIFLFILLFLGVVDMELYSYWGFKLDITPLMYLKTPREAAASINFAVVTILIILLALLYICGIFLFRRYIICELKEAKTRPFQNILSGLIIIGLLFIPIRGGIGIAPVNLGSAYFHNNRFANHSAINVLWNSVYSIAEYKNLSSLNQFMNEEKANELFYSLYPEKTSHKQIIKKDSNIILIILESFSNKIIGELGGEPGITPELDTLCRNSVVFRNFYSSGDRSDKGIVSLLSGYPAQPTTSIVNFPSKTQKLPFLMAPFHQNGYYTAFYYGGDINFANLKSYFTNPWMDKLITKNNFPAEQNIQKWGVPDEYLFEKMKSDIDTISPPFFISFFTLSSHEPYDMPMDPIFHANNMDGMSKNGFYYTDKCLGKFIDQARLSKWWDSTLIIIVADHGSRSPGNTPNHVPGKFKIPMIWTGGALIIPDTSIYSYASHTDLPSTLLSQFDIDANEYKFSKDVLNESSRSFAMYFFNNGFGYMSDSAKMVYDLDAGDFVFLSGNTAKINQEIPKAYLQVLSGDYNTR